MDKYGHVNNMIYYGYFDTVVTDYIVRMGRLDTDRSPVVGLVVESHCNYHRPIAFPVIVECGLRVGRLGRSSVRYEIGVFTRGEEQIAADGHFIIRCRKPRPLGVVRDRRLCLTKVFDPKRWVIT